jgi:hypothetical protein
MPEYCVYCGSRQHTTLLVAIGEAIGRLLVWTGESLAKLGLWVEDHLWPLAALSNAAERLTEVRWKPKLVTSVLGAVFGIAWMGGAVSFLPGLKGLLVDLCGSYASLVAVSVGAALGWMVIPIGGALGMMAVKIGEIAIGLTAIAAGLLTLYLAFVGGVRAWGKYRSMHQEYVFAFDIWHLDAAGQALGRERLAPLVQFLQEKDYDVLNCEYLVRGEKRSFYFWYRHFPSELGSFVEPAIRAAAISSLGTAPLEGCPRTAETAESIKQRLSLK